MFISRGYVVSTAHRFLRKGPWVGDHAPTGSTRRPTAFRTALAFSPLRGSSGAGAVALALTAARLRSVGSTSTDFGLAKS